MSQHLHSLATEGRQDNMIRLFIIFFIGFLVAILFFRNDLDHYYYLNKKPLREVQVDAPMKNGPALTLWFDDAWISQYNIAFPILNKFNMVAAVAVPTSFIEFKGEKLFLGSIVKNDHFMSWSQIRKVRDYGWEITSHTQSHSCEMDFYTNKDTLRNEFEGSMKILKSKGFEPLQFVMPCGTWVKNEPFLSREAMLFYDSYRSLEPSSNPLPLKKPYDVQAYYITNKTVLADVDLWIKEAVAKKSWIILTFHTVDDDHEKYAVTPQLFEMILELVQQYDIPVVLPSEVIPKNAKKGGS